MDFASAEISKRGPLTYFELPPSDWSGELGSFSPKQTVEVFVPWGAHERLQGIRDFSRVPRLRIEKLLSLAYEQKRSVEIVVGFQGRGFEFPHWCWGVEDRSWYTPKPEASQELSLLGVPSLFNEKIQEGFFDFVRELISLVALYREPEGPVRKIRFDFGPYVRDTNLLVSESYERALASRYGSIEMYNQSYQTTFREFSQARNESVARIQANRRPWLAHFDFKWCRKKMLQMFSEKLARAVSEEGLSPAIVPEAQSSVVNSGFIVEDVWFEVSPGSVLPCLPFGEWNASAANAFHIWSLLSSAGKRPRAFSIESVFPDCFAFFCGSFISRKCYEVLERHVRQGGSILFPFSRPKYDENLIVLSWERISHKEEVHFRGMLYERLVVGEGSFLTPKTPFPADHHLGNLVEDTLQGLNRVGSEQK